MKQFLTLMMMLNFAFLSFSQCADVANIYTFTHDGKTYEVVKEKKSWINAAACAVERGGYLVEINDINEQNAMYDAIINGAGVSPTYVAIPNGGNIAYVWIGATDQTTEGTWLWDGNSDYTGINFWTGEGENGDGGGASQGGAYCNWGGTSVGTPNEPDNYGTGQHHGAIALAGWPSGTTMLGVASEWNDIIGSSLLYYVVEKDANSIQGYSDNSNFRIYPNPTKGLLNITGKYNFVDFYDVSGKLLQRFDANKTIDISKFDKAIYYVRVITDSTVRTEKIILK